MSIDPEYAIKKDIRNNPVVREIDRQQTREFLRTGGLTALIVAMLLFSAWQHSRVVRSGYEVERLRKDEAAEAALNRQLRLEVEMLQAPGSIAQRAGDELHMTAPSAHDTIVIERALADVPSRAVVAANR
jgi:hypothetical protein